MIENKQCLHLCKQSTCKVADEYDSWFNLSLISKRGYVKCPWLNHECLVKKWLHCVMGSQLCKWSLFDAWFHSRRSMQIPIWTGLTPGRRSQPRHLVPHTPIMKRRLQSDHELTTKREWCETEEPVVLKSLMWALVQTGQKLENRRWCYSCFPQSVHDKNKLTCSAVLYRHVL